MEKQNVEGSGCTDQEHDPDEQKMEEFFALIRRFHEAKNRRKEELLLMEQEERTRKLLTHTKKMKLVNEEPPSWVPTFQREDFAKEIEFRKPSFVSSSPLNIRNKRENRKRHLEEEDEVEEDEGKDGHRGLDLKLAL